jgi:hypothetical protein
MIIIFHRTIKSVISVWMDTYPDDFREDPDTITPLMW